MVLYIASASPSACDCDASYSFQLDWLRHKVMMGGWMHVKLVAARLTPHERASVGQWPPLRPCNNYVSHTINAAAGTVSEWRIPGGREYG